MIWMEQKKTALIRLPYCTDMVLRRSWLGLEPTFMAETVTELSRILCGDM